MKLTIAELPAAIWNLDRTFKLTIDRSAVTVDEYLKECGITWIFGQSELADIDLVKEDTSTLSPRRCIEAIRRRYMSKRPYVSLIGEPRQLATAAYFFAAKNNTLAVAPGDQFKRLYFASEWVEPRLDDWNRRLDKICWIARPTPERVRIARQLVAEGIPLEIYSRERWPLSEWKGHAEDEVEVSRQYCYRIVCENSLTHGYHSEKLFNSIRCGCVTFYLGDPDLDLSHAEGAYLPLQLSTLKLRRDLSKDILSGMDRFMFSDAWEIYSFRNFYDRIVQISLDILHT